MKLFGSRFVFTVFVIVAGFLYLAEVADGANEFRKCYNTSVEMHCFDLQYDNNNRPLTTSNDNARQRCRNLNSTLLIIKDEETNNIVQSYMSDPYNPIGSQYVWTDAYRINDYNSNSYTWHWVNSKLPNLAALEVGYPTFIWDSSYYTTTLEFRSDNGTTPQFYLTAKQPQNSYSYLCEYSVYRCSSTGSNVLQFSDRCYISFIASVSWYEARNRCLKDGGELASFPNVTSINFTSWLGSDQNARFWIGLRFSWYIWKDSGEDVKFSKWTVSSTDTSSSCLIVCSNCVPSYSWSSNDCNTGNIYVVCHSVTPLGVTTATAVSVAKTTSSAAITTFSTTTTSDSSVHQAIPPSSKVADGAVPVGIGLGVGLGVPLVIFIILTVVFAVKIKRLETLQGQKTRSDNTELEAVHESSVGKVNDSANSQYQQLNRSLENTPETTYDELRVSPETPYEEFPSQRS